MRTKLLVLRRLLLVAFATAEDPLQRLLLHLGSTALTPPQVVKSLRRGGTTFQSKYTTVLRGYQRLRRLSTHMDAVTKLREKHIDVKKGQKRPLEPTAAALLLLLLLEQ